MRVKIFFRASQAGDTHFADLKHPTGTGTAFGSSTGPTVAAAARLALANADRKQMEVVNREDVLARIVDGVPLVPVPRAHRLCPRCQSTSHFECCRGCGIVLERYRRGRTGYCKNHCMRLRVKLGDVLYRVVPGPSLEQRTIRELTGEVIRFDSAFSDAGPVIRRTQVGRTLFLTSEVALQTFAARQRDVMTRSKDAVIVASAERLIDWSQGVVPCQ